MTSTSLVPEPDYHSEARFLIRVIKESGAWPGGAQFSAKEIRFVRDLERNLDRPITRKMIFWLRDIRDRSLE